MALWYPSEPIAAVSAAAAAPWRPPGACAFVAPAAAPYDPLGGSYLSRCSQPLGVTAASGLANLSGVSAASSHALSAFPCAMHHGGGGLSGLSGSFQRPSADYGSPSAFFAAPPSHAAAASAPPRRGAHMQLGAPPPRAPEGLTEGFPTPESVAVQKAEHGRALDEQMQRQLALIMQRHNATLDFLRAKNEQQKRHTNAAIDQAMMQGENELQAKFTEQMMMLSQAANHRKFDLENQARTLAMEYNMRRVHEELLAQDYEVHRKFFEASTLQNFPLPTDQRLGDSLAGGGGRGGAFSALGDATHGRDVSEAPTGDPSEQVDHDAQAGTLHIIVLSASGLMNKDTGMFGDLSDPFVVVKVGKQEHKTPVIKDSLNPVWDKGNQFTFKVGQNGGTLEFEVFNSNKLFAHNSLGSAKVDLRGLPPNQRQRKREKLHNGGGGELEFETYLEFSMSDRCTGDSGMLGTT